jgi:hypothetical protein
MLTNGEPIVSESDELRKSDYLFNNQMQGLQMASLLTIPRDIFHLILAMLPGRDRHGLVQSCKKARTLGLPWLLRRFHREEDSLRAMLQLFEFCYRGFPILFESFCPKKLPFSEMEGGSALYCACESGTASTVKILLQHGVKPLHFCDGSVAKKLVHTDGLLRKNLDSEYQKTVIKRDAVLLAAVYSGSAATVSALLTSGHVDVQHNLNLVPFSIWKGNLEVIKVVWPCTTIVQRKNAFRLANLWDKQDIMEWLLTMKPLQLCSPGYLRISAAVYNKVRGRRAGCSETGFHEVSCCMHPNRVHLRGHCSIDLARSIMEYPQVELSEVGRRLIMLGCKNRSNDVVELVQQYVTKDVVYDMFIQCIKCSDTQLFARECAAFTEARQREEEEARRRVEEVARWRVEVPEEEVIVDLPGDRSWLDSLQEVSDISLWHPEPE